MKKMGRPKSDNAKKKVLSIRVPDQLYSQMLAYAEQHKMTINGHCPKRGRVHFIRAERIVSASL